MVFVIFRNDGRQTEQREKQKGDKRSSPGHGVDKSR